MSAPSVGFRLPKPPKRSETFVLCVASPCPNGGIWCTPGLTRLPCCVQYWAYQRQLAVPSSIRPFRTAVVGLTSRSGDGTTPQCVTDWGMVTVIGTGPWGGRLGPQQWKYSSKLDRLAHKCQPVYRSEGKLWERLWAIIRRAALT